LRFVRASHRDTTGAYKSSGGDKVKNPIGAGAEVFA